MIMSLVSLIAGLLMLFFGGDAVLKGALSLAHRLKVSSFLVSLVIMGFGTSLPELIISLGAVLDGTPAIVLGNVIGSNIANILLILGSVIVVSPCAVPNGTLRRDLLFLLTATFSVVLFAYLTVIPAIGGVGMLVALIAYLVWAYRVDNSHREWHAADIKEVFVGDQPLAIWKAIVVSVFGLLLLIGGSYFLIQGVVALARYWGVGEQLIALSIVAVGSSLPEFASSLIAAIKGEADMVIGNVIGSNLFNILAILGISSAIKPLPVTGHIQYFDVWVMMVVTLCFAYLLFNRKYIERKIGVGMVAAYCVYIAWLFLGNGF